MSEKNSRLGRKTPNKQTYCCFEMRSSYGNMSHKNVNMRLTYVNIQQSILTHNRITLYVYIITSRVEIIMLWSYKCATCWHEWVICNHINKYAAYWHILYVGREVYQHEIGYICSGWDIYDLTWNINQSINQSRENLITDLIRLFIFKYCQIQAMKN